MPTSAVQSDDNGKFVWFVADDRVKRRVITSGKARDGRVVIERGVSAGERIVLDPPAGLKEDTLVRVVQ